MGSGMRRGPDGERRLPLSGGDGTAAQITRLDLPTPGGVVRGLGEAFTTNPVTGSARLRVPLGAAPGRSGFGPDLAIAYDSSSGQGPFGFGWTLELPSIARKTERGLPRYDGSDTFVGADGEDLVPAPGDDVTRTVDSVVYRIRRYRPRIDGTLARIEHWTNVADLADTSWRTISAENVTAWFGRDPNSRIADPRDPVRVYRWLISATYDDKGNLAVYEYKPEDGVGVDRDAAHEAHRTDDDRSANRYLKSVRYGAATPYYPHLAADAPDAIPEDWHFHLVLDYGEHDADAPAIDGGGGWPARPDPFSNYRPGFEVRTHRRCRRALMFHQFAELGDAPQLASAVELDYAAPGDPPYSLLATVTRVGFNGAGETARLPPLELGYQEPRVDTTVRRVPRADAPNVPYGFDAVTALWVDLQGEGASGILAQRHGAWYFSRNLSPLSLGSEQAPPVAFARAHTVDWLPTDAQAAAGTMLLTDMEGSGRPDVLRIARDRPPAAARHGTGGGWQPLAALTSAPTPVWSSDGIRLTDLTGDGRPDIVVDDATGARWYEGLGADGFGKPLPFGEVDDDGARPRLVFADKADAIQLADMTGDGLPDLVHLRNGSVSYRPNLGYGRFGHAVEMDAAPWFDAPDAFDPRRLLLADVDGTGTTDLVYLGADGVRLYRNDCGNRWADATTVDGVPGADTIKHAAVVDLRGTGTACLVWSSALAADAAAPMHYVDLHASARPYLLDRYANGLGTEVSIEYLPSTTFALRDESEGRPWPMPLPFPVQCAHRVTTVDRVRETTFTTVASYHDGYYDGVEREFRGFGLVETVDTESYDLLAASGAANGIDPGLHRPPVLRRTWFHTGAAGADGDVLQHTRRSQYAANDALPEYQLPEPALPAGLTDAEVRDAVRALKGQVVRSEVLALDDTAYEGLPYAATESTYRVHRVQSSAPGRRACFRVSQAESITYHYERVPDDPRVEHTLVLETDELGFVKRSAAVSYPRSASAPSVPAEVLVKQSRHHVLQRQQLFAPDVTGADVHRLRRVYETRTEVLEGTSWPSGYLTAADIDIQLATATAVPYERLDAPGVRRRLIERRQVGFLADDLSTPRALGSQGALGLVDRTYRLALSAGLADDVYGTNVTAAELIAAGYVQRDGDWWAPSGQQVYGADARDHFYLPSGQRDAFGNVTAVEREHDLIVRRITDPLGHAQTAVNDFRVLRPRALTDANGNTTEVAYDALGSAVALAVSGKGGEGDTLASPTTTVEYDLFAWRDRGAPTSAHIRTRERHQDAATPWQEAWAYFDGAGAVMATKTQAPPGNARIWNAATSTVEEVDTGTEPRWIGTGRTVLDNKGAPVKQYEPYFSPTHEHDSEAQLVEVGVTPITRYDPLGRVARVDLPDGAFSRVEYGPWSSQSFDANDTVADSRWFTERGAPDPSELEPFDPDRRAAWLAVAHARTPRTTHFDSAGRAFWWTVDNGVRGVRHERLDADLTGHVVTVRDALDRAVATAVSDLIGNGLSSRGGERGQRWVLTDVAGAPVKLWDDRGRTFRIEFDSVRRPIATRCLRDGSESVLGRVVYGDAHPEAAQRNLIGQVQQVFDTAGVTVLERADFRGRPLELRQRLRANPEASVDWTGDPAAQLEPESFTLSATYDALGRPEQLVLQDGTVVVPEYDVASRLSALRAQVRGAGALKPFLAGQDYDAAGRRLVTKLGNGLATTYDRDELTQRLCGLVTKRQTAPDSKALQRLRYTYDAAGNITEVADAAQATHFFANAAVASRRRYTYDALYQLVGAEGRENGAIGQSGPADIPSLVLPHPNDATPVRRYRETYEHDELGNLRKVAHSYSGGGWTRHYRYAYDADAGAATNRLIATSLPGDAPDGPYSAVYQHDADGNVLAMPHLPALTWDLLDRLVEVDLGGGGTAYYNYDAGGNRVRKVVQRQGGLRTERRYLGAVERHREWSNGTLRLERWTLHVADDEGRLAQVDTLTVDVRRTDPAPLNVPVARYEHTDVLGSVTLETSDGGVPISYEEFHPFGSVAYRSARKGSRPGLKRYRYGGKERDEETGFDSMGARCYAPWLGRWISPDPAGLRDGLNPYAYCGNDPVNFCDPTGTERRPYRYPELEAAMAANPGSFHVTGDVAAAGRDGRIRFRVVEHATFGRVWQFVGAAHDENEVVVWGGPTLIREQDALARWRGARVGRPEAIDPSATSDIPPGAASPRATPEANTGGGGREEHAPTTVGQVPTVARGIAEEVARPSSVTGAPPRGTLHVWSGAGKQDALNAIARDRSGWMMGNIEGSPTPEHARAEVEFEARRAAVPGGRLSTEEMDRIWGYPSRNVVARGAFAGHPVQGHGPYDPTSIQVRFENSARAWGGGLRGGLAIGTGMFAAIAGASDPNAAVAVTSIILGVGEATSGIIYASGAILASTEAMAIGTAGTTAFGGAAAAVGFGVASYRSFERGDALGGVANAAGALGGALLVASLFTPVGWVALVGLGLVALAAGFNLGRWWSSR
jgi:RHS repeat-associated protein